jgi:hypothetical protein
MRNYQKRTKRNLIFDTMKTKSLKLTIAFILVMIVSCDEPETVVTDIVHPDGSITRKIEMKNMENKFALSKIQVPFDTTWTVRDSLEISDKGDTTWVKRAEKFFRNADELNRSYLADSGSNRDFSRRVEFKKVFKWFNTEYRFAEVVNRQIENGYPVSDFLNAEELKWFYSPDNIKDEKKGGEDSLKYRAFDDTIKKKTDLWTTKCLASEWSAVFLKLTEGKTGSNLTKEYLKEHEDDLIRLIKINEEHFDSLWKNGIILREFLGEENGSKFKPEADSAASIVTSKIFESFHDYSVKITMPGKLIGANGFADSTGVMMWPVKSDFFVSENYKMWADSKTPNKWTWVVTGIFLLFVLGGIIFRAARK